jgi:membrane protease YdiL (CAAX protease family)
MEGTPSSEANDGRPRSNDGTIQPLAFEPSKCTPRRLSAVWRRLSRHLSLFVIFASWILGLLRHWSPREITGWTLGHLFKVALLQTAVTWVFVFLLLRNDRQKTSDLGLRKAQLRSSFLPGICFGLVIFAICNIFTPWLARHWLTDSNAAQTANWFRGIEAIPIWIFLGWLAGGLTEELSRAFVLTRFEKSFGRAGLIIAIILSSIIFGLGHLYQGQVAAFSLSIGGAFFGLVYLRRRNCWEAAISHATFDTIGITLLFVMNWGRSG